MNLCKVLNTTLFSVRRINNNINKHYYAFGSNLSWKSVSVRIPLIMAERHASKFSNCLTQEKSPYLLQHAHNPVDWYPWGAEAILRARTENKLIFLSVGYSTCHWCHVMERESFENVAVAKVMNENFVCVKVDREERPDVDHLYMTFVQATSGSGGWPMSVWLTPDLLPVYGGTYYPPEDMYGRPGFVTVLKTIAERWQKKKDSCIEIGQMVVDQMRKISRATSFRDSSGNMVDMPTLECSTVCFNQLKDRYEHLYGGFSNAPKFPQPVFLRFLLYFAARRPSSDDGRLALTMTLNTLKKMAKGGIHDHVSQGFARYSTDGKWHVPHFEKMLYDQGQLVAAYAEAHLLMKTNAFDEIIRDIMTYVNRDLSHPSGGFYSAEDADSLPTEGSMEKKEGAFCVWTYDEVTNLIKNPLHRDIFVKHYNVLPEGNVHPSKDPHGELKNQNVLIVFGSEEETAEKFKLSIEEVRQILKESREILHEARQKRPRPHLDDKFITAWNGLMISGASKAGAALDDCTYVERAIAAAKFIRKNLYLEEGKILLRSCYRGTNGDIVQIDEPIQGFLDDYAFLINGLIDLYEASYDPGWLEWADTLQETQDRIFWDDDNGGYFSSRCDDPFIYLRLKDDQDGAEPSGNSVAVSNLLRLGGLLNKTEYRERASHILKSFADTLDKFPIAVPALACGLLLYHDGPVHVYVTGKADNTETQALLKVIQERVIPGRILALADGDETSYLYRHCDIIHKMKPVNGLATAYVCRNDACSLPVTNPDALRKLLDVTPE